MSGNKQDMGASAVPSGSRASHQALAGLDRSGFDPSRDIAPIDLAGRAMKAAWDYIKSPEDPPFEDVKSDHRILAMATALVATEHLVGALRDIRGMVTPSANATVRRMAHRAASAIETQRAKTEGLGPEDESAARRETPQ